MDTSTGRLKKKKKERKEGREGLKEGEGKEKLKNI